MSPSSHGQRKLCQNPFNSLVQVTLSLSLPSAGHYLPAGCDKHRKQLPASHPWPASCCQRWPPWAEPYVHRAGSPARGFSLRHQFKNKRYRETWTFCLWDLIPLAVVISLGAKSLTRLGCDLMKAGVYHQEGNSVWRMWMCPSLLVTWRDLFPSTVSLLGGLPILQMCILRHRWCTLIACLSMKCEQEISHPWHLDHKITASDIYWERWRAQYTTCGLQGWKLFVWPRESLLTFLNLNFLYCAMSRRPG